MKVLFLSVLFFLLVNNSDAQFLKKLGENIKRDSEWRIRNKVDNKVSQGLDSVIALPKKIKDKKKQKNKPAENPAAQSNNNDSSSKNKIQNPPGDIKASVSDENDMMPKDGYITLSLSDNTAYTGFGVMIGLRISGESIKYKNYNQVQVVVTGPSTNDVRQVAMNSDGKFFTDWNPTDKTGEFTVTATSSDKKTKQSATFKVETLDAPDYDKWPAENISETKKALDKLEETVDMAGDGISPNDKKELDKKMDELKEKVNDVFLLFKDLGKANKELMQLAKKEKKLPPGLADQLVQINRTLADQASQMKKINESAVHKPQDNTICEHLVMVNEACAALATFTAPVARVLKTALGGIASYATGSKPIDKENTTNKYYFFFPGKIYSIYAAAKKDADGISTKLTRVGFAADLAQFAGDVLLQKYCGIFKGEIKHDYTINFRNESGISWWKYGAEMQGALVLRYPKEVNKGKIIKLKGSIEGNATKFTFYENAEANDDFQEGTHGKIEVVELRVIKPATIPFVSSLNDLGGFGAVARGLTPASFYITIDAEYDVDANKIKIFFNNALMDFTSAVNNQLIFLEVGADLFPYIKKMTFPIAKVFATFGSVIRSNNEFIVDKDSKGNLSFTGKANKHIGDKSTVRETDLNFTISAKKE